MKAAEERLNGVKANLEKEASQTEASIKAKVDAPKGKLEQSKRDAENSKAKVTAYFDEKKAETEAKIAEWKRERHQKNLDSRANRDEDYAVYAINMACAPQLFDPPLILQLRPARIGRSAPASRASHQCPGLRKAPLALAVGFQICGP